MAYYVNEAGEEVAIRFLNSIDDALTKIRQLPFGYSCFVTNHEKLRMLQFRKKNVDTFPFMIFYRVFDIKVIIYCMYQGTRELETLMVSDFA